jgi:transcriptional regulator with GAF, ATPase, and Fis domain
MKTEELEQSDATAPARKGEMPMLWIVHSPDAARIGTRHPVSSPVRLVRAGGGAPGLALDDPRVSREQALVQRRIGGGCEVRDLESRNGTFVDGRRVDCATAPIGSIIRVGDTLIEVAWEPDAITPSPLLVGRSAPLCRLASEIERFARSDVSVLLFGETGTGKELVAEALHAASGRTGRLVAVNCASIPPTLAESYFFGHRKGAFTGAHADAIGVFEQAHDGTLFLDEIGELRLDLQSKLLRVLETRVFSPLGSDTTRTTNARIVSATNANLRVQMAARTFRADLFARIAELELVTPPLRQRRCDLPLLMDHFFRKAAPPVRFELSVNALESLLLDPWPMNVRELKSVCTRLALAHPRGGRLRSADVVAARKPGMETPRPEADAPTTARDASPPGRDELFDLLRTHAGNVATLATLYGKDRKQIYRWLEQHGLDPRDFRD